MKRISVPFVYICAVCFLLLGTRALAQEGLPLGIPNDSQQDPNQLNLGDDKTLLYEPSFKNGRDSVVSVPPAKQVTPASKPKSSQGQKPTKEEEDALSFNFLYYIIQKFKFSDIIDQ